MLCCALCCVLSQVPDELDNIPMVDEALASAAYTTATAGARTPSRKTRWTTEQIEALIEGVEKYGLSAWRTIVMVSGCSCVGEITELKGCAVLTPVGCKCFSFPLYPPTLSAVEQTWFPTAAALRVFSVDFR